MTWQSVPWAVGGGALVPVEAGRLLAYYAIGGLEGEGPAGPGDCAVLQTAAASGQVRIMPGAVGCLNRMADPLTGGQQAYLARQPETELVTVPATGGSARTDVVAVVIEDPQYAGQAPPTDIQVGPYVKTVLYTNVSATARNLADVDPGQAGYALARITRPANTTTVTQAHITDLRAIPNPRTRQVTKMTNLPDGSNQNLTSVTMVTFPSSAAFNVEVPRWAVKAHLELYVSGARILNTKTSDPDSDADDNGNFVAHARCKLGAIITPTVEVNPATPTHSRGDTFTYAVAGEVAVPAAMRGTTQTLEAQALRSSFTAGIEVRSGWGTTVIAKVTFFEEAATDAWEV